ncbi:hypothetical protein PUR26_06715 [Streptomyces sp. SP18CS02]|nr:hypothetical protein [Streptomyces sp. SP18CS02]
MAEIPAGVTAGIAVYDRETGRFTEQVDVDRPFRSASVVKLLIALDVLWDRGPGSGIPEQERPRLEAMLRSSDDAQASHYWAQRGGAALVGRMVPRLGLTGTLPPPAGYPAYWGYTAITAADTVRVYRHVLDVAPAVVREFVMDNLHRSTRCANDGFDQYFGIPSAFEGPWAVKQGWSGFSSGGCTADGGTPVPATRPQEPATVHADGDGGARGARALDLVSEALHTTGTVGPGDRTIVAVLTLHPDKTSYGAASSGVTRLTDSLDVPGARRPAGSRFGTWGSGVRVREATTTASAAITTLPAGIEVLVGCQKRGQTVSVPPYVNDWWAYLPQYDGYVTNIYLDSPDNKLPGVRDCAE